MSVIKAKRKLSRFEVLVHANNLHDMLLELMQRNFGIKSVEDYVRKKHLFNKTQIEQYAFYKTVLMQSKQKTNDVCRLLIWNVRAANTIYPKNEDEIRQKREYQNNALVNCEQLKSELMRIVTVFNVDLNMYKPYILAIQREEQLIKNWRQSNKILL